MSQQHQHSPGRGRWSAPAVRDDMIRRYVEDLQSIRQVAAAIGCSYGTVHLDLTSAGVTMRPHGGARRRAAGPAVHPPDSSTASAAVAAHAAPPSSRAGNRS
ncbi:helix-turn-helix domain-containing protein [Dactylosporangium cerinum]